MHLKKNNMIFDANFYFGGDDKRKEIVSKTTRKGRKVILYQHSHNLLFSIKKEQLLSHYCNHPTTLHY
jgi:hypothetical protein